MLTSKRNTHLPSGVKTAGRLLTDESTSVLHPQPSPSFSACFTGTAAAAAAALFALRDFVGFEVAFSTIVSFSFPFIFFEEELAILSVAVFVATVAVDEAGGGTDEVAMGEEKGFTKSASRHEKSKEDVTAFADDGFSSIGRTQKFAFARICAFRDNLDKGILHY